MVQGEALGRGPGVGTGLWSRGRHWAVVQGEALGRGPGGGTGLWSSGHVVEAYFCNGCCCPKI